MKHLHTFNEFLNEGASGGLFTNDGKDRNKFLFSVNSFRDTDTLTVSIKNLKKYKFSEDKVPVGNNYQWQPFANQCSMWEHYFELGRMRYDVEPEISFTIPRVAKIILGTKIMVEPIANLRMNVFEKGTGTNFSGSRYEGNYSGRGPAWMNKYSGSVKVSTVDIRERMEKITGQCIRAAYVDKVNWEKLAITVQYKDQGSRIFNPAKNQNDLYEWVDSNSPLWTSVMDRYTYDNPEPFWNSLQTVIDGLKSELPSQIVCKVKTV